MQKMNPEVKKKWVAALRSGDYKQGQGRLKSSENEYCCLGVLCDIYKNEVGGKWQEEFSRSTFIDIDGAKSQCVPSPAIRNWAGIDTASPQIEDYTTAIMANDSYEYDFNTIANLIEANL